MYEEEEINIIGDGGSSFRSIGDPGGRKYRNEQRDRR